MKVLNVFAESVDGNEPGFFRGKFQRVNAGPYSNLGARMFWRPPRTARESVEAALAVDVTGGSERSARSGIASVPARAGRIGSSGLRAAVAPGLELAEATSQSSLRDLEGRRHRFETRANPRVGFVDLFAGQLRGLAQARDPLHQIVNR